MKKLAALLFLLSAVLAQGLTFDQTWRVDLSTKQTKELSWFQGQSITLNLASTTNGGRYNLSGTNVVVIWQGVAATNTEQTWFVVTGTVANATNGQSTYELTPEQSNLLPDFYYGFVQALRVDGTNLVFMDVLGMQSIEVLYNPDVRYTGYHGPLSYDLTAITVISNYVDTLLAGTNTALKTGTTFHGPTTNEVDAFFKSNVSARTISVGDPGEQTNITSAKMTAWDGDRNGAAASNVIWVSLDSPADPPMSKGWTNNIQAAINSCPPGGSVLIAPGDYALTAGLVVTTKLTIAGMGRDATIIRGGGSGSNYRGFTFSDAGMTSVVEDLTITEFRGVLHGAGAYYGVFNRCNFINNSSTWGYVEGGGQGGAAHSAVLNDCLISGNYAQEGGGGLRTCVARNCVISNNVTAYTGGGAYGGTLDECIVQNNYGANGGGGCDRVDLFRCTILDNALGSGNNGTNLWDAWMEDCWVEEGVETLVEVGWTNCVIAGVLWFNTELNYLMVQAQASAVDLSTGTNPPASWTDDQTSVVVGGGVTTNQDGNTKTYILGNYLTPAGGTVDHLQINSNLVVNEGGTAWYIGGAPGQFFISAEGDFAEDEKGPPFLIIDGTNGSLHLLSGFYEGDGSHLTGLPGTTAGGDVYTASNNTYVAETTQTFSHALSDDLVISSSGTNRLTISNPTDAANVEVLRFVHDGIKRFDITDGGLNWNWRAGHSEIRQYTANRYLKIRCYGSTSDNRIQISPINNIARTSSGIWSLLEVQGTILPTSGGAEERFVHINPTFNQQGGATGSLYGLYVNVNLSNANGLWYPLYVNVGTSSFDVVRCRGNALFDAGIIVDQGNEIRFRADYAVTNADVGLRVKALGTTNELYAFDSSGNEQQLTAHKIIDGKRVRVLHERNLYTGEGTIINMDALAEAVQQLSGRTDILTRYTFAPTRDWDAEQSALVEQSLSARAAWQKAADEYPAQVSAWEEEKVQKEKERSDFEKLGNDEKTGKEEPIVPAPPPQPSDTPPPFYEAKPKPAWMK